MGDPTVDRLLGKREQLHNRARSIRTAAESTDRNLTDDELAIIKDCNGEIGEIDRQLETLTVDLEMPDALRDRIASASGLDRTAPAPHRTVGELVYDAIHAPDDEDSRRRYAATLQRAAANGGRLPLQALDRAAQHMGTLAADTVAVAGDLGGLTITPVVGPVINPYPNRMPLAAALGLMPATAGEFTRPYIVDTNFPDGGMGPQGEGTADEGKQKAELPSEAFTADSDSLKMTTLGGYLNVSLQLQRWQPGSLGVIIDQLNRRRSAKIERALMGEVDNSTGKITLASGADFATTWKAITDAVARVGSITGEAPTVIAMGWLGYARLAGFTDAAGRPLFPFLGAANSPGTANLSSGSVSTVGGLTPVVTPSITDDTFWILNGACVEGYVYYYGVLEAVEPSVLGRQVAVAADFAAIRPTPHANAATHLAP